MALDSKQKRGSAISISLPQRQWLAEPDGTLANTDRVSLAKLCSAIVPASPGGGPPPSLIRSNLLVSPLLGGLVE